MIFKGLPQKEVLSSYSSVMHLETNGMVFLLLVMGAGFLISLFLIPFFMVSVIMSVNLYVTTSVMAAFALAFGYFALDVLSTVAYPSRQKVLAGALMPLIPITMLFILLGFYDSIELALAMFVRVAFLPSLVTNIYEFDAGNSLLYGFVVYGAFNVFIMKSVVQEKRYMDLIFYAIGPITFIMLWIGIGYIVNALGGNLA